MQKLFSCLDGHADPFDAEYSIAQLTSNFTPQKPHSAVVLGLIPILRNSNCLDRLNRATEKYFSPSLLPVSSIFDLDRRVSFRHGGFPRAAWGPSWAMLGKTSKIL